MCFAEKRAGQSGKPRQPPSIKAEIGEVAVGLNLPWEVFLNPGTGALSFWWGTSNVLSRGGPNSLQWGAPLGRPIMFVSLRKNKGAFGERKDKKSKS